MILGVDFSVFAVSMDGAGGADGGSIPNVCVDEIVKSVVGDLSKFVEAYDQSVV